MAFLSTVCLFHFQRRRCAAVPVPINSVCCKAYYFLPFLLPPRLRFVFVFFCFNWCYLVLFGSFTSIGFRLLLLSAHRLTMCFFELEADWDHILWKIACLVIKIEKKREQKWTTFPTVMLIDGKMMDDDVWGFISYFKHCRKLLWLDPTGWGSTMGQELKSRTIKRKISSSFVSSFLLLLLLVVTFKLG